MQKRFHITDAIKFALNSIVSHFDLIVLVSLAFMLIVGIIAYIVKTMVMGEVHQLFNVLTLDVSLDTIQINDVVAAIREFVQSRDFTLFIQRLIGMISVLSVLFSLLYWVLIIGWIRVGLSLYDTGTATFKTFFSMHNLLQALIVGALYSALVAVGLALLIIPGLYLAVRYYFAPGFVLDKKSGILQAFKQSAALTAGARWQLLGFLLLINIIMTFVPILAAPMIFASVYVYRKLGEQTVKA